MAAFDHVQLIENDIDKSFDTLVVSEDAVRWGSSITLNYVNIILHAMCTDIESYPKPCIYMQVETSGENMSEIRLVPQDPSSLQALFDQLSKCAALHPDLDGEEEGEQSDSEYFDATTNAMKLQKLESVFIEPTGMPQAVPGQFDEVDEDDEE